MDAIRQLTQKGDPRLNILMPKAIKRFLADAANAGKRRPQDEMIKRLAATMKNEEAYNALKNVIAQQINVKA